MLAITVIVGCKQQPDFNSEYFQYHDILDYYAKQGPITDPGKYEFLYNDLPDDPRLLVDVVQGLLISEGLSYAENIKESQIRQKAYDLTRIEDILKRVYGADTRSLMQARKPEDRLYGICSNFATLYCSILRHKNIPSRVRAGHSAYSTKDRYVNHYICEYWNREKESWVAVDPEIPKSIGVNIDNFTNADNIEDYTFITAGMAWLMCREGILDPHNFGLGSGANWESFGWDMLRPGVYSDFMTLNKFEMHPWDITKVWDLDRSLTLDYIDSIAEYSIKDEYFERRILIAKSDERMRLPNKWK